MSIGAAFVLVEIAMGIIGLVLSKLLLGNVNQLMPTINGKTVKQAFFWSMAPIAVAILLASPWADAFYLGSIKAMFAKDPMPRFVGETSLITLICFSVAAGTGEELLFRGALQTRYGIWIAALIFGLVHTVSFTLFGIALILGLYFGLAYERSGRNLFVPAFAHAFCDLAFLLGLRSMM